MLGLGLRLGELNWCADFCVWLQDTAGERMMCEGGYWEDRGPVLITASGGATASTAAFCTSWTTSE
jgi:hypothetical protein